MQFSYELNGERYIYRGPRGHGGIAYSLAQIHERLTQRYGGAGYELVARQAKA